MAASAVSSVTIRDRTFSAFPNPALTHRRTGQTQTSYDTVDDFAESANGAFRILQFGDKGLQLATHALRAMGASMAAAAERCDQLAKDFGTGWRMLGFPRLYPVTRKAMKAVAEWRKSPSAIDERRERVQQVHNIAEAATAWGYAGSILSGSSALRNVADVTDVVASVTDLRMAAQDWTLARDHLDQVDTSHPDNEACHDQFTYTMRLALIKSIKATASVFNGVIGLLALTLGAVLVSPLTLLAVGMISTTTAVLAHFYEKRIPFERVDFFRIQEPRSLLKAE
jgi:hypothetical protein